LARSYHPDVSASPDAQRQMRQLNAAYGVLSDPSRRARYDAVRMRPMRARREVPEEAAAAQTSPSQRPAAARPVYIRAVPPTEPMAAPVRTTGPRMGRIFGALLFVLILIGAAVYGLWLIAGILDEEPLQAMTPNTSVVTDAPPPPPL